MLRRKEGVVYIVKGRAKEITNIVPIITKATI